jgi:hypothetical protein
MELSITTPALLFPAISLLMLAYTNRFLAIANLIRNLHDKYKKDPNEKHIVAQIRNLRVRIRLIRNMQAFGVISFLFCVVCYFAGTFTDRNFFQHARTRAGIERYGTTDKG